MYVGEQVTIQCRKCKDIVLQLKMNKPKQEQMVDEAIKESTKLNVGDINENKPKNLE